MKKEEPRMGQGTLFESAIDTRPIIRSEASLQKGECREKTERVQSESKEK